MYIIKAVYYAIKDDEKQPSPKQKMIPQVIYITKNKKNKFTYLNVFR